jgi:L-lactate dehydrogenase complex protein LldE
MRVGLAVPCYVDQFRPATGRAALAVLERLGCEVSVIADAVCCGQPLVNAGLTAEAAAIGSAWAERTDGYDAVVVPSGSCTHHIRRHLVEWTDSPAAHRAAAVTCEWSAFVADLLRDAELRGHFPHAVSMHLGCHAQRGLRLGGSSELHQAPDGPMHRLLTALEGVTIVPLDRVDECCGFGGSFAIGEPAVSVAMGRDRLRDAAMHGAEVLVSSDVSCMLHLAGIAHTVAPSLRIMHIAELVDEATR